MILEVSQDPRGMLLYFTTNQGTHFEAHGANLCPDQSPRTIARWKATMDELVANGILEPRGYKGDAFALRPKAYDIADILRVQESAEEERQT